MRITTTPVPETITWFAPQASTGVKTPIAPEKAAGALPAFTLETSKSEAPAAPVHRNRFAVSRTAGTMPVFQPRAEAASFAPQAIETKVEAGQRLGFGDLIDIINPLQHIPLVGAAYRQATGDTISPAAQFMGGTLFGGPLGAVAAMADIAIRERTGTSMGDRMLGMVTGTPNLPSPVQLAARWNPPERMAGSQPIWNAPQNATAMADGALPAGKLSPQTGFAMLLNDLSGTTPHIS